MLEGSIKGYTEAEKTNPYGITFFDRGLLDTLCYAKMIGMAVSEELNYMASQYKYNKNVFLLPAWKEIYETDSERKQNWQEAVYTYEKMKETYLEYGYSIIEVPKLSVVERADFILSALK
ncbi:AAA family ATPase [Breznakiella homolactica]|uniref:AAA family ATPase n=1 Tax=Breznakiella homolactica TaxID=2798577 RepID=A0A7T8BA83_9SPIR|nr:AAA family ATPase [Breznakiella homolactica]